MLFTPLLALNPALPKMIIPPQSPGCLPCATVFPEVNTIGLAAVPIAFNLEPLVIIKAVPLTEESPLITTPGWIVKVALFLT